MAGMGRSGDLVTMYLPRLEGFFWQDIQRGAITSQQIHDFCRGEEYCEAIAGMDIATTRELHTVLTRVEGEVREKVRKLICR